MEKVITGLGVALLIAIVLGPILIPILHKLKFGQYIRSDGPKKHLQKAGTPTMGGLLFIIAIAVATLIASDMSGEVLLILASTLIYGIIGFLDDFIKVVMKRNLGLRAKQKLFGQIGTALALLLIAYLYLDRGTGYIVPFSTDLILDFGFVGYLLFGTFIIVGITNAVNLTDGLDGLAAGVTAIASIAYVVIAMIMDMNGVAVIAAAVAGGCIGFLRYNFHPAKIFMGDTGSLALGGALGGMALITKTELFLAFIGIVYVVETLSVIIQVISFKTRGKRVFLMSPLHHHYELKGWTELKTVGFFWLVAAGGALLGIMGIYNL